MTAADDLIRRRDAINGIRNAMKWIYTAARKRGYKEAINILEQLPSAGETEISLTEPVSLSPAPLHSHWFIASGWWMCDNCGGKSSDSRSTPYCPWCGARMDELLDEEIEWRCSR